MLTTPFFLLCPIFLAVACNTSLFFWSLCEDQIVTDYDTVTSTSSEMACVRECMTHSQCDACAYDRESGTCYLQVQTGVATEVTSNNTAVYKAVYPCKEPLGHDAGITADVLWRKSGWELEGNVICDDDDYMYIGESPTYRCSSLGKLTANPWECRQRIWRNPATGTRLNVPKPPEPGWSVCVNGTPTAATRFSINLVQNEENFVVHVDFRQNHFGRLANEITLARKVDNEWEGEVTYNDLTPFPLAVSRTFTIVIKAPTLNEVQIFVDGTFVGNYTTLTSVDRITKVFAGADVIIDMIDLWCDQ